MSEPSKNYLPREYRPREYRQRRARERNRQGLRVLIAECPCGWDHMSAYRLFHKRAAAEYLIRCYNAHPCRQP